MKKLYYKNSADHFYDTLLLGNGRLGATVYGGINEDVYNLNDDTLWSGYPRKNTAHSAEEFREMRKLVSQGQITEAEDLAYRKLYGKWSQEYLPAGDLIIKGDYTASADDYTRTLSLDTAIHTVTFGDCCREAFISYPDDVLCIRYAATALPTLEITLKSILRSSISILNDTLLLFGEAPGDARPHHYDPNDPHAYHGDPANYYEYKTKHLYSDDPAEKGMRYTIGVRVRTDGSVTAGEDCLRVCFSSWLEIYVTIKTSFAGYDRHPYLEGVDCAGIVHQILDKAMGREYSDLKTRHIDDYHALYNRVELDIDGDRDELPTDERLALHSDSSPDLSLYALLYQYARYLTIASSREGTQATNLQGIWNVFPSAPWSCSYTTNINTQMNYWGTCGANLAECCKPLHQLIYDLTETGASVARDLFGAEGFCVNHNTDLWRMAWPAGDWRPDGAGFAYFPLAGAWLTRHLYEYYLETRDLDFLNGKAFDSILESARFCDSMLTEQNGKLYFTFASSPENRYCKTSRPGITFGFSQASAMFQSIVRDIFEICITCCRVIHRETDYADYLAKRLPDIPWLEINSKGRIAEFDNDPDIADCDPQHRHISHLYSFYPVKSVTDPRLIEACKQSLNARGIGTEGWSSVWKACIWAGLKDSEKVYLCLNQFIRNMSKSLLGTCGGTFQIDCTFGYLAVIHEILFRETDGTIELLPALPPQWKNGRVKGIRVNGKTIEMEWKDNKIISSSIIDE